MADVGEYAEEGEWIMDVDNDEWPTRTSVPMRV